MSSSELRFFSELVVFVHKLLKCCFGLVSVYSYKIVTGLLVVSFSVKVIASSTALLTVFEALDTARPFRSPFTHLRPYAETAPYW